MLVHETESIFLFFALLFDYEITHLYVSKKEKDMPKRKNVYVRVRSTCIHNSDRYAGLPNRQKKVHVN